MANMDLLLENALRLVIAKLPPEVFDKLAIMAKSGVDLKAQLDRIEEKVDFLTSKLGASNAGPGPGPEQSALCSDSADNIAGSQDRA
jgi:hypothetical protein